MFWFRNSEKWLRLKHSVASQVSILLGEINKCSSHETIREMVKIVASMIFELVKIELLALVCGYEGVETEIAYVQYVVGHS